MPVPASPGLLSDRRVLLLLSAADPPVGKIADDCSLSFQAQRWQITRYKQGYRFRKPIDTAHVSMLGFHPDSFPDIPGMRN